VNVEDDWHVRFWVSLDKQNFTVFTLAHRVNPFTLGIDKLHKGNVLGRASQPMYGTATLEVVVL